MRYSIMITLISCLETALYFQLTDPYNVIVMPLVICSWLIAGASWYHTITH